MQKREKIRIPADILQFIVLPGACTTWHACILAPGEFGSRTNRRKRVRLSWEVENVIMPIADILADSKTIIKRKDSGDQRNLAANFRSVGSRLALRIHPSALPDIDPS
jgi:hypothetical protein